MSHPDPNWRDDAACIGIDVGMFFPDEGHSYDKRLKAICQSCPVQEKCLDHALRHEAHGMWAGTEPRERQLLRKQRNILFAAPEVIANERYR